LKKTPKGQPSTNEDTLQRLAEEYDLPKIIIEYRGLAKLKSTYTDSLINIQHPCYKKDPYFLSTGCYINWKIIFN
jgi:DNA polymerase-1